MPWFFRSKKEKIDSVEYLELLAKVNKLSVQVASLEIDLALYVKKLKASKGLDKKEDKNENDINDVLVPI